MLKILLNLIFFVVIVRVFRSLFRRIGARNAPKVDTAAKPPENKGYSDLTPYEIEDADYEEIRKE